MCIKLHGKQLREATVKIRAFNRRPGNKFTETANIYRCSWRLIITLHAVSETHMSRVKLHMYASSQCIKTSCTAVHYIHCKQMAEFEHFGIRLTYRNGAGYQVITAMPVVCDVTPCRMVKSHRRFEGSWDFEWTAATDPTTQ